MALVKNDKWKYDKIDIAFFRNGASAMHFSFNLIIKNYLIFVKIKRMHSEKTFWYINVVVSPK